MVPTRDLARLLAHAERSHTKVVLVGDHKQLPEIEAGGSFAGIVHRFEALQLDNNRRQVAYWEREALRELRSGSVDKAMESYLRHERVITHADPEGLREQMARDWAASFEHDRTATMIALERRDVRDLNNAAREELKKRGLLGERQRHVGGRDWSEGDRIVCLANSSRLDLTNGMRGTVVGLERDHLKMETDRGALVRVPFDYIHNGHADHAYAITGHKAQGMTVNEAFVLASPNMYREWTYVAMSRAREQTRLYAPAVTHHESGIEFSPSLQHAFGAMEVARLAEALTRAGDGARSQP